MRYGVGTEFFYDSGVRGSERQQRFGENERPQGHATTKLQKIFRGVR